MKILIIALFVFVAYFVSSPVLAGDSSNKREQSIIQLPPKKLKALNCEKSKGGDCSPTEIRVVKEACNRYSQLCEIRDIIDLYKPNYVMYSFSNHNDNAFEIQYSGRYNLKTMSCVTDNKRELYIDYECVEEKVNRSVKYELFFSLTGRYDFYAFSNDKDSINRKSAPVINRFFNPALHARFIFPNSSNIEFLDLSIEHLSNGQSGDFEKIKFTAGEGKDNYEESDGNSISMFFPSVSAQLSFNKEGSVKYKVFARAIFDYWETELNIYSENGLKRVKIDKNDFPHYHRFKIGTMLQINDKWLLNLSFTGHRKTSFDALASYPLNRIPYLDGQDWVIGNFLIRYHNGYLSRLSNYDLKEQTIGIGFGVAF